MELNDLLFTWSLLWVELCSPPDAYVEILIPGIWE